MAQAAAHAATGHAHSLRKTPQHRFASAFPRVTADWAFGAGSQAVTFVSRVDEDYYVEQGLTWYASTKALALTPGHSTQSGERYRIFDPSAAILRCFQCHSTGTLRLGEGHAIEPSEPGVQCESCHGPGSEHVALKKPLRNPGKMTAAEVNGLCGGCHRMPAAAGDNTNWANPWNARHQPLYLAESLCFRKSEGKLSCNTCHSPHQAMQRASFDSKCSSCHAAPKHRTMVKGQSCIGCHMPAVRPQPTLSFANHWIGVYGRSPLRPIR